MITASYGFGETTGEVGGGDGSTKPAGVLRASELTAAHFEFALNEAATQTLIVVAWDFGTDQQRPLLKYADYDGADSIFNCNRFPANACGTLLPGQGGLTLGGPSLALFGDEVTLSATGDARVTITFWLWQQLQGPTVTLTAANSPELKSSRRRPAAAPCCSS